MKKHTRATPAGVPRSRSKFTRRERRRFLAGYIARRPVSFVFPRGMVYSYVVLTVTNGPLPQFDYASIAR